MGLGEGKGREGGEGEDEGGEWEEHEQGSDFET